MLSMKLTWRLWESWLPKVSVSLIELWASYVDYVGSVLEDHKARPPATRDLVQVMLTGRDKETGMGLSDDNIKKNVSFHSFVICDSTYLMSLSS